MLVLRIVLELYFRFPHRVMVTITNHYSSLFQRIFQAKGMLSNSLLCFVHESEVQKENMLFKIVGFISPFFG